MSWRLKFAGSALLLVTSACSSDNSGETSSTGGTSAQATGGADGASGGSAGTDTPIDIRNAIFDEQSGDCSHYAGTFFADVTDIQRSEDHRATVTITTNSDSCELSSNSIPNHDFDDAQAHFATPVSEVSQALRVSRVPSLGASSVALSQQAYDAVLLNGVVVDILSAGCYKPSDPMADADGNVAIGCTTDAEWLLDPLSTSGGFGVDSHNAHTQPDGMYHYHGNPEALFDDSPGPNGSPVIGFAADGFPIYGSYFLDPLTNEVRQAKSGYTLKQGVRPSGPGGSYSGTYIQDYEFTDAGDLDECNGMTVDGQYGYYVTDAYPWMIRCFVGTPDSSFQKGGNLPPP